MTKRKNKGLTGEEMALIVAALLILTTLIALISQQLKINDMEYTCNIKGELLKADSCYEKNDDFYCKIDNVEYKVSYYYTEVK